MKMIVSLLSILAASCFAGCVVESPREVRVRPAIVVEAPPPVVVREEVVPYDDPGRGWYIEGYYTPAGVYIAPFWTLDIEVVHTHFDHYRGSHRSHFDEHFRGHPERFENRGPQHPERQAQHPNAEKPNSPRKVKPENQKKPDAPKKPDDQKKPEDQKRPENNN